VSRGVSAVVPNKDGTGLVGRSVAAALAAGAGEVIVVDDGSTDDSPDEAAAAGAQVIQSKGRGFSAAVNTGAATASGDHLLLLNSDCFVEPEAIGRLVEALEERPSLGACGAALVEEDGSLARSHGHELTLWLALRAAVSLVPPRVPDAGTGIQIVDFLPLACVLVPRSTWADFGGLDERYPFYFEDQDFCWRLREGGRSLAVRWDARAVHIGGGSSQRREPQRWFRQYHESRARYLRKRYPRAWPLYAAVWVPSAIAHALAWRLRRRPHSRQWARAYLASALAGLGR
jgi:N-acetylglucosaminyl-diphospho-decaprenol L-rhamnosyltransferase